MTLEELIKLREGSKFLYKGEEATIVWTEYTDEYVGHSQDGTELRSKNFGMYFMPQNITIRSCHPRASILKLPEYVRQ